MSDDETLLPETAADPPRKPWHDLAHTAAVLIARAFVEHELSGGRAAALRPAFTFALMAAATSLAPPLPQSMEAIEDGLNLAIEERGPELWLTLQLVGFSALDDYRGQSARLTSGNGAIDYPFAFDAQGQAVCVLSNRPDVRDGLTHGLAVACEPAARE
jgi:hypothetical protein